MKKRLPALAKLSAPSSGHALNRGRLFKRLDAALATQPLVWVVASPGSGKTTLATTYLKARRRPTLWYAMDAGDAGIATFFHYLAVAAEASDTARRPPLPPLTAERRVDLPAFTREFFEQLGARLPAKAVIVFDNQQECGDGEEMATALATGLSFLREGQRVFVLSRKEPPPALASLEVANRALRLAEDDLRLTPEEARSLAGLRSKDPKKLANLAALQERTRGWVAGMVMLLDSRGPLQTPDLVLDYLAREYVDRLPDATREVLTRTALAPVISSQMASALGLRQAMTVLSRMARRGAFVTHREGAAPSYEVHPLLRELLLRRLEGQLDHETLVEQRRIVAQVSASEGNDEAAVSLYAANEDWQAILDLADVRAPTLMPHGEMEMLERWLKLLPADFESGDLRFTMLVARTVSGKNPPRALEAFSSARDSFTHAQDLEGLLQAWTGTVLNVISMSDDLHPLDECIREFDVLVPVGSMRLVKSSLVMVSMIAAMGYRNQGHPRLAEWFAHGMSLLEGEQSNAFESAALAYGLSSGLAYLGDLARAEHVREIARPICAAASDDPPAVVFGCLTEANIAIHAGEPEASLSPIEQGLAAAAKAGIPIWNHLLEATGALGAFLCGNLDLGHEYLARLAAGPAGSGRLGRAQHAQLLAYASLLEGKLERGVAQAESAVRLTTELGALVHEGWSRLVLCELHIARSDPEQAERALQPLHNRSELGPSRLFEAQTSFAQADIAALRGLRSESSEALGRAFALAAQCGTGLLASALVTPEALLRRCHSALAEGIEVETVCRLLRVRSIKSFAPPAWLDTWPWQIKIQLLGRLRIHLNGAELESKSKPQVRVLELLQLLVLAGGSASEATIADALWPEADGDQAQQALSIAVHRLRALLGDPTVLERRAGELSLDRRRVFADVWAIESLLENATGGSAERRGALVRAAQRLHAGPPAAVRRGDSPSWLLAAEKRLTQRFNHFS